MSCGSNSPPSSDRPGFKPPERRKGSGPELLPIERVDEVVEHWLHRLLCPLGRTP
jgi:hypothetical protein